MLRTMTRTPHLTSTRHSHPLVARSALVALALVAGACSLGRPEAAETTTIQVDNTAPATTVVEPVSSEPVSEVVVPVVEEVTPSTTAVPSTVVPSTVVSSTPSPVAGEPLDYGPQAGTELIVVGVQHDDVLNFRVDPDPQATIVTTAAPLASHDIVALGSAWAAPTGVWWLVEIDGQMAWGNQGYLAAPGESRDLSEEIIDDLPNNEFQLVVEALMAVASSRVHDSGPEPVFVEVDSYTTDVLGFGDDSVKGERLTVTIELIFDEENGDDQPVQDSIGIRIVTVEVTPLCSRGVLNGLCV